ncbi:unnamed protein product [Pipistrellus nathusii]|uniref:Uncharacterized protein n=1 Tax=Pipistrellus nathusii TaxID=59473 RepID=A0ABN9ZY80_PIPNA
MATRSLARRLGLIRTRARGAAGGTAGGRREQPFAYLMVLDFEATCWAGGERSRSPEIRLHSKSKLHRNWKKRFYEDPRWLLG